MPQKPPRETLSRLFEILKLLPSRGQGSGITAKEIHEKLERNGFSVNKRTVERDLNELSRYFGLECNDQSIPYGWRWMAGARVDIPSLTVADALSLRIVEGLLRPLLPHALMESLEAKFAEAQEKLKAMSDSNPNARWVDKVYHVLPSQPFEPPAITPDILATIQDALLKDLQIDVIYQKASEMRPFRRRLHPLGIVQRGAITYLVASRSEEPKVKLYAVHRVQQATTIADPVRPPEGFSLQQFVREGRLQFGSGESVKLEAMVAKELAAILAETPLAGDQLLTLEGERVKLSASVLNTWQLSWWILSQGPKIEILKPLQLRKAVAVALQEAAARYTDQGI